MIKAVLLDLDETLIDNPHPDFVYSYLGLIDGYFEDIWQYKHFSQVILQSMQALRHDRVTSQTNADILLNSMATTLQRSYTELKSAFTQFYNDVYPQLEACIDPVPSAKKLISFLQSREFIIVIATNPLYSPLAVQQRLEWGGLDCNLENYAFVTHAENMHFIKPDPAYYTEILARVGIEPDEAIMVGDNVTNDIEPARLVGIHTFHITDEQPLSNFLHHMQNDWANTLFPYPHTPEMIPHHLTGNLGALWGLIDTIKPHYWNQHPDPNEWSPLQIICHLAESETTTQRPRLQHILSEDNPFLTNPKFPPSPQEFQCHVDGVEMAGKFVEERYKTLAWLKTLQTSDWHRTARHSIFGPTTLLEMAYFTAQHDRLHLNQLCQTLGRCE